MWDDDQTDLMLFDVLRFPMLVGDSGGGMHKSFGKRIRSGEIDWKCVQIR